MSAAYDMAALRRLAEHTDARAEGGSFGSQYRARELEEHGGACDVPVCDSHRPARFSVEVRDGRRFEGCAIHGSGGVLRGSRALVEARARVAGPRAGDARDYIDVYTVLRWYGSHRVRVPVAEVVSLTAYEVTA